MEDGLIIGKDENDEFVSIRCDESQRMLVCGKTGTGKSYTLGVIVEELMNYAQDIVLVVDPQGIFWTMGQENTGDGEIENLWEFNRSPKGFRVNVLVPGSPEERYGGSEVVEAMEQRGINIQSMRINPSDLNSEMWVDLFNLDINDLMGSFLSKAVNICRKKMGRDFFIDDIIAEVSRLKGLDKTKEAVERKLEMAQSWQIFEESQYREIWEILEPNSINVMDLSVIHQGRYGLRNLVVAIMADFIFRQRTIARRRESLGLPTEVKKVWMAIDEAHNFCPAGKGTLSKEIIIRWAKEGRQPGLSLIVASQQPAAIDNEILTQCGIRIVHRITSRNDTKAINALSHEYIDNGLSTRIKSLTQKGQTLLIDDDAESLRQMQVRPRQSLPGGSSA